VVLARKDLAINGDDLLAMGYKGKPIKIGLGACYLLILQHPEYNEKTRLLNYLERYLQ
jgi:hypothetical protein